MPSVNEALYDAINRHQIYLIRFGGSAAKDAVKLLAKAEKDLVEKLAARVAKLGPTARDPRSKRYRAILQAIRSQSADLTLAMEKALVTELLELAKMEVDIADRRLNEAFGVQLNNFRPSPEVLRTLVTQRAVRQRALKEWFKDLSRARAARLEGAVALAVIEGDTTQEVARRFKAAERISKRSAEALVRTHINHVANQARQALYQANDDLVDELRWTATLDGRTSDVCKARDGETYPLDEGPRPPAHPNCRSVMSPVVKSWQELTGRRLKPGRGAANLDNLFEKELKAQGFDRGQRASIIRGARSSMNGQVPGKETYNSWLRKQPKAFVEETLGPAKAKLYLDGKLSLDRFIEEPTGRSLTLAEIKARNSEAWMQAFTDK